MDSDESYKNSEKLGQTHVDNLNALFAGILGNLEGGRTSIFEIAEECRHATQRLQTELLEVRYATGELIKKVDEYEKLEKLARLKLMKVSGNFERYNEEDIKDAYNSARELKVALIGYRNQEYYLRKRRDDLEMHIKQFHKIMQQAEGFLNSTTIALKLLQGNLDKISVDLEDMHRKQLMELWLIESQEAERRKIARELHDGPAQSLASMLIRLDLVKFLWEDGQDKVLAELDNIKSMGQESIADIRRLMFDLKPTIVNDEGFDYTLKEYFDDYEAKYNFNINCAFLSTKKRYDLSLEIALYRLVQEAITNVRKHAGVNEALVKMEEKSGILTIIIRDEGCGFDLDKIQDGRESYGILGMKERVEIFGGKIDIISAVGKGTQVIVRVPIKEEIVDERKN
ncbi:MAG: hypothetical protein GX333_01810 [Syntrophomonadaceae bacterium]|nr:hypothetical protein [Syntrophomonadaceae bacterium]